MTIESFQFDRIKEHFELTYKEEKNMVIAKKAISVRGDTGARFNIKVILKGMIPTTTEPNVFLVHKKVFDGRGAQKYYEDCNHRIEYYRTEREDIEFRSFQERRLVGIEKNEQGVLFPIYYSFDEVNEEPVIREKREGNVEILYFYLDNKFYKTEISKSPLKLMVTSDDSFVKKCLQQVNQKIPFLKDKYQKAPFEKQLVYLDHPLEYFAKEIGFNQKYKPKKDGRYHYYRYDVGDKIVVVDNQKDFLYDRPYRTFEEFCYVNEDKYEDVRKKIVINNEKYQGEKLFAFEKGDKVKVTNPFPKQLPIKDFEGVIEDNWRFKPSVKVRFFDYFEADINPLELSLIERKTKEETEDKAV